MNSLSDRIGPEDIRSAVKENSINDGLKARIDIDIANCNNGVGVLTSEEVAREKLNLKLVLTDRRLKDLIDFMLYIYKYYNEGITKQQLLSMVNDKSKIAETATKDIFEDCMNQASKFRGVRHPDTYVADFFVLLEGLLDQETTDNMIFIDGVWQYKRKQFLTQWANLAYCCDYWNGGIGLQFSINTLDENDRDEMFHGKSLSLKDISELIKLLPDPVGRKYTLNFAVTSKINLDVKLMNKYFDKEKCIVKITPIHETRAAVDNKYEIVKDFDVYSKFEEPLVKDGWDVIVFVPSYEEDSDRITCGNALISEMKNSYMQFL